MLTQACPLTLPASARATARPRRHRGPRLALGISLLLHGVAMAWMLRDAPVAPDASAPRVQVALIEAPRPPIQPGAGTCPR